MKLICALFFLAPAFVLAGDDFKLTIYDPCNWGRACATEMLVSGVIPLDAAERFDKKIKEARASKIIYGDDKPIVGFDSPGGSLVGGVNLGYYLRANNFTTMLQRKYVKSELRRVKGSLITVDEVLSSEAKCASACVLAFIGGVSRSVEEDARVGIHQASSPDKVRLQVGQSLTAALQNYSLKMTGVQHLADEAIKVSADEIKWLSLNEIRRLQILPTEIQTPWELRRVGNDLGFYAKKYYPLSPEKYLELYIIRRSDGYHVIFHDKNGKHVKTRYDSDLSLSEKIKQMNMDISGFKKIPERTLKYFYADGDRIARTSIFSLDDMLALERGDGNMFVSGGCGGSSIVCFHWSFDMRGLGNRLEELR